MFITIVLISSSKKYWPFFPRLTMSSIFIFSLSFMLAATQRRETSDERVDRVTTSHYVISMNINHVFFGDINTNRKRISFIYKEENFFNKLYLIWEVDWQLRLFTLSAERIHCNCCYLHAWLLIVDRLPAWPKSKCNQFRNQIKQFSFSQTRWLIVLVVFVNAVVVTKKRHYYVLGDWQVTSAIRYGDGCPGQSTVGVRHLADCAIVDEWSGVITSWSVTGRGEQLGCGVSRCQPLRRSTNLIRVHV